MLGGERVRIGVGTSMSADVFITLFLCSLGSSEILLSDELDALLCVN